MILRQIFDNFYAQFQYLKIEIDLNISQMDSKNLIRNISKNTILE